MAVGEAYERCRIVDAQLAHQVGAMVLGGLDADAQFGRHFLAAVALCDQQEHFAFTRC